MNKLIEGKISIHISSQDDLKQLRKVSKGLKKATRYLGGEPFEIDTLIIDGDLTLNPKHYFDRCLIDILLGYAVRVTKNIKQELS